MADRPVVIVDTSVFLQDALSPERKGAASQLLAMLPTIAHVVMCTEVRDELQQKLDALGWTNDDVRARYGPIFDAAIWVEPVAERPDHLKAVRRHPVGGADRQAPLTDDFSSPVMV